MLVRCGRHVLVLALALVVVGCGPDPDEAATDPPSATEEVTGRDGPAVTLPPEFLECGERESDTELTLPDVDLTTATWDTPSGFAQSFDYVEEFPPANQLEFWVAEPSPNPVTPNAVAVAIHGGVDWTGIADPCARVPVQAVHDWLAEYHERNGAQILEEAEVTTIAGHRALTQLRDFTDRTSRGYWLFSETQVLVVYCQWNDAGLEAQIGAACTELVDSVSVGAPG